MRREYKFDYREARPNRFALMAKDEPLVVLVDPGGGKFSLSKGGTSNKLRKKAGVLVCQRHSTHFQQSARELGRR